MSFVVSDWPEIHTAGCMLTFNQKCLKISSML